MDIEDVISSSDKVDIFKNVDLETLQDFVKFIVDKEPTNKKEYEEYSILARRKFKMCPKKAHIVHCFRMMVDDGLIKGNDKIDRFMTKKLVRIASGVEVITVFTSPTPDTPYSSLST